MLRTGKILRCTECQAPLAVEWWDDDRCLERSEDASSTRSKRCLCYPCSRSELSLRIVCGFEQAFTYAEILGQIFNHNNRYIYEARATVWHSNILKVFLNLKIMPEIFWNWNFKKVDKVKSFATLPEVSEDL